MEWPTRSENQATCVLAEKTTSTHIITHYADGILAIRLRSDVELPQLVEHTKDSYMALNQEDMQALRTILIAE